MDSGKYDYQYKLSSVVSEIICYLYVWSESIFVIYEA